MFSQSFAKITWGEVFLTRVVVTTKSSSILAIANIGGHRVRFDWSWGFIFILTYTIRRVTAGVILLECRF